MSDEAQVSANIQTAMDLLLTTDQTVEEAAAWLMRQEPEHFTTIEDAVKAIT